MAALRIGINFFSQYPEHEAHVQFNKIFYLVDLQTITQSFQFLSNFVRFCQVIYLERIEKNVIFAWDIRMSCQIDLY